MLSTGRSTWLSFVVRCDHAHANLADDRQVK
jgi:hypothetical protein